MSDSSPGGVAPADSGISESEKHFREMADSAPMMVWVTDPTGYCTFLSESWYRFTGQTTEEGLGYGWVNALHPDDRVKAKEVFTTANARRGGFRVEYRLRQADGEYRWALDSATPRFNPEGSFLGYIGSVVDISERHRAEKLESGQREVLELMAKDAPLTRVFERLVQMVDELSPTRVTASIMVVDGEKNCLRNGAAPGLRKEFLDAIEGIAIGDNIGSCGTAAFRKEPIFVSDIGSSPLWKGYVEVAISNNVRACWSIPILASDGRVLGTFGLYYPTVREPREDDIRVVEVATRTAAIAIERRQSAEALRVSRERLDLLIEASQVGVWFCDLPFTELIWDARVKEHFWLPPDARVTIELFYERLHPDDREKTRAAIEKSISEHSQYDIEYRTVSPEEKIRWVRAIGKGFYDRDGKPIRFDGVTIDISKNKALEAELREAEATLEHTVAERTAKLKETIGDLEAFSYSVSHDLRSPLRAMQGYAEELIEDAAGSLSPTHRSYLERIYRAASRLDRLTQDILSYSKLSNAEIHVHRIDVERLVHEIIEQYPHLRDFREKIRVRTSMQDVIGNEAYLTQAISNLLNNAVKFVHPEREPEVRVYTEENGGMVRIVVADNGIGIEQRHYERIYHIFGRIHPDSKYAGTGIGLAIVKKTAERMGGRAGFDSEWGVGSKFWLELPKAE